MSDAVPRKPARRWKRRLVLGAAVFAVLAFVLVASLPSILSGGAARARIEAALGSRLGAPVRLGSLRLSWFGSQEVRGLRVGAPVGASDREDLLDAQRVVLSSGLVRLLRSGADGLRVEIERPNLNIHRDAEGRFNFAGLGGGSKAGGAKREGGAGPAPEPRALPEIALAVRGGTLRYRDDLLGSSSSVANLEASAFLGRGSGGLEVRIELAGDTIAAEAKAALQPVPGEGEGGGGARRFELELRSLEVRDPALAAWIRSLLPEGCELDRTPAVRLFGVRLAGALAPDASPLRTLEGEGKVAVAGALRYRGIAAADLEAGVRVGGGAVEIRDLRSTVNGGRVVADASLGIEAPRAYRLAVRADGVAASYDMAPLLAYALPFLTPGVDGAEFSGTVRGALEVEGRGFSFADLEAHLRGKGSLRVLGGSISASGVFAELSTLLRREFGRALFEEAGSDFEISEGRVASKGVFLRGKEGGKLRSLRLAGSTSFDGTLDYGIELSAIREAIGDREARRILEIAEGMLGGGAAPLPLRLAGTLSKPRISLARGLRDVFEGIEKRLK